MSCGKVLLNGDLSSIQFETLVTNIKQSKIIIGGVHCAVLALFIAPAVFGVLGIAVGMVAIVKDAR